MDFQSVHYKFSRHFHDDYDDNDYDYDDNGYDEQENDDDDDAVDDDDDDDANNLHSSGMGVQSASQTKAQDRSQKLAFRSKMHASAFFKLCSTQGQNQLVQCLIAIQLH